MRPPVSAWDFWAPLAMIAIGLYRFWTGDTLLSALAVSMGTVFLIAGLLSRRRRM